MRPNRRLLAVSLFSLMTVVAPAASQQGTIAGTVTDGGTGQPLPDVQMQVLGASGGSLGSITNLSGRFQVTVAPGTYTLVTEMIGYEGRRVEDVQVVAGQATSVRIALAWRAIVLDPIQVTVGRKVQKATEAPAAVSVVSEAKIQEKVVMTPIEHMKDVVGVDVINYGISGGNVVARGFNNIFSGALHFLTDNRIASIPSLQVNLMQFVPSTDEDISRMEVVLGPGAALYGPNTANGVLHVITKSPLEGSQTTVSVAGGERDVFKGVIRTSQLLNEDFGIKLSASYFRGREWEYTDPVERDAREDYTENPTDFADGHGISLKEAARVGRRDFDIERWGGEARADWRFVDNGTAILQLGRSSNNGIELTGIGGGQAVDWTYSYYQARMNLGRLFAQAYLNTSDAGDTFLLRRGAALVDRSKMWVGQLQHGTGLLNDRLDLIYGLDYKRTIPESDGTIYGRYETDDEITEFGAYLQAEAALSDQFSLVGALRHDQSTVMESAVWSPRAAIVFTPVEAQSFRLTYNRAFSTPTSLNYFLDINGGRAPEPLGTLGYLVRATGSGKDGLSFQNADGTFRGMRSPFAAQPSAIAQVSSQNLWQYAVTLMRGEISDQEEQALRSFNASTVGINVFDAATNSVLPLAQARIPDVLPLEESITTTFELGYQGVINDRVALAADVWTSKRTNFTSPLTPWTPFLLLDGPTLVPPLTAYLMQLGFPQAQAQAQQIAQNVAPVPLAVASSPDIQTLGADLITTYVNYGELDLWGADVALTAFLTDEWSLGVTGSLVSEDVFRPKLNGVEQIVALNAPKEKGSVTLGYRNTAAGVNGELRARYTAGFPAGSAVYVGTRCIGGTGPLVEDCVESATILDLTLGYRIPNTGATAQLYVSNILDSGYRSFVGVPDIGRLALVQLKYEF